MKKLKIFILIGLIISTLMGFVACGTTGKLDAPAQLEYNIENELTWLPVEEARGYYVEIVDVNDENPETNTQLVEVKRTSTKLSLSFLPEGDYDIRVRALAKDKEEATAWSTTIHFQRGYETGCVYMLINNDTEYRLTRYGTAPATIFIEDEYRGKPVTEIGPRAFKGYNVLENVEIGDNVRKISDNAFYGCKGLKSVTMGDSVVEIGASAFQSCSVLESVVFTESVTTINDSAFAYCRALKTIELPSNLQSIGTYVFSDCSALEEVVLPDTLASLGGAAFTGCTALKKATIGAGLTELSASAFYKCSALENVVFAEDGALKTIGVSAFADCFKIASIEIPEGVELIGVRAFDMQLAQGTEEIEGEEVVTITAQSVLENVTLPSSLNSIGTNAFAGTKLYMDGLTGSDPFIYVGKWIIGATPTAKQELKKITWDTFREGTVGIADSSLKNFAVLDAIELPDSVRYIGGAAFQTNAKLRRFEVSEDSELEKIDIYGFADCRILDTVILSGSKLKTIAEGAFMVCPRLSNNTEDNILTPDSLTKLGQNAFAGTMIAGEYDENGIVYAGNWVVGYNKAMAMQTVELREDTVGIADFAFANNANLKTFQPTRDLKYIGRGAFYGCSRLDMLYLSGTNVRRIEDYAFYACTSLAFIEMPVNLSTIGRAAFYGCAQLKKLNFTNTKLTEIGPRAFNGCGNLEEVKFSKTLTTIGEGAFYKCQALKAVDLPNTVTTIEDYAFAACYSMTELKLGSKIQEIGDYAFSHCNSITRISFPNALKRIGNYAFYGCNGLRLVSFNDGLESIGDCAFFIHQLENTESEENTAKGIKTLTLPSSLKEIGNYAFAYNVEITSVFLNENLESVGEHVFYACNDLTVYVMADSRPETWKKDWNTSFRPVIFGCTLSESGEYVASIVISENSLENTWDVENINAPERLGYTFVGWATSEDGEFVYTMAEIVNAPEGATLYAVWVEA